MKTTLIFSKLRNRIREGMWNIGYSTSPHIGYYSNQSNLVPPSFRTLWNTMRMCVENSFIGFVLEIKCYKCLFPFLWALYRLSISYTIQFFGYEAKIYEVMKCWVQAEEVWGLKNLENFVSSLETVYVISSLLCATHGPEHGTLNIFTSRGIVGQVFYTFHQFISVLLTKVF